MDAIYLSVVPMKTLYSILYVGVFFRKTTNKSNFSSFKFQLQFFTEAWLLTHYEGLIKQNV
jgi:hypothetical protein